MHRVRWRVGTAEIKISLDLSTRSARSVCLVRLLKQPAVERVCQNSAKFRQVRVRAVLPTLQGVGRSEYSPDFQRFHR